MSRENREKEFAEKLDRILAGEDIHIQNEMDDDLRASLDFARKMSSLRVEPSAQFKSYLKAKLLQQLNEREADAEAGKGWLARLVRQPIWQAVAVLVLMIVVGGAVWGSGILNPSRQGTDKPPSGVASAPTATAATKTSEALTAVAPTTTAPMLASPNATPAPADNANTYLSVSATTDEYAYQLRQPVNIRVEWQNLTSQNLTIDEYPPILSIMDKSTGQAVYTFQAGRAARTLTPGEKADYIYTWNQDDARERPVGPGVYYVELEEMYYQGRSVPMILANPVDFTIY